MAVAPPKQRTAEFYLSSLWSWLPEGSKRILDALESCELQQALFEWDERCDWFYIRCLEDDREYVMNEYLKVQREMENELKEKDMIQDDGGLTPNVESDLVGPLRSRVAVPDESGEFQEADSIEHANIRYPKGQGRVKKTVEGQVRKDNKVYQF